MKRYNENASEDNDLNELAKEIEMTKLLASTSNAALSGSSAAQLDDILSDLDLDVAAGDADDAIEEIVEAQASADEPATITEDELANVDVDELEMSIDREAGYAEQKSDTDIVEAPAKPEASAAATPTPRAARAPSAPRAPRDMNSLDAKVFVLEGDVSAMSDEELTKNKATVMSCVPSQKKIAEKFENLFAALHAGKQPSVYVKQAFKLLDTKKSVTGTDITAMFKADYKQGTAQSQAGQIMKLFEVTKIASRDKNTLTLNADSVVAKRLREIFDASANSNAPAPAAPAAAA